MLAMIATTAHSVSIPVQWLWSGYAAVHMVFMVQLLPRPGSC